jgi:hypothetical protein
VGELIGRVSPDRIPERCNCESRGRRHLERPLKTKEDSVL